MEMIMNAIENPTIAPVEMPKAKDPFLDLYTVDVSKHVEAKNGLSYLSWSWAWAEVRKRCPGANYNVLLNNDGMPYFYDDKHPELGIMCWTSVTINGETHLMWLPVMDSSNAPMRFTPYEIQKGKFTSTVKAATMFDVNKTIMRCLAKNLAMFGLGLYIYSGEDLPEEIVDENDPAVRAKKLIAEITAQAGKIKKSMPESFDAVKKIISDTLGTNKPSECTDPEKLQEVLDKLNNIE